MELEGVRERSQRNGLHNPAFQSQDSVCIDVEEAPHSVQDQDAEEQKKRFLELKVEVFHSYLDKHRSQISLVIRLVLAAGYVAMVIAACVLDLQRALALLVLTLAAVFFLLWDWLMGRYGDRLWDVLQPARKTLDTHWVWLRWVVCVCVLVAVVSWLVLDTAQQGTRQLVAFSGLACFILLTLLFSKHPFRVSWRTLLGGVGLQFLFGLLILRTTVGFTAVNWLGTQVEVFFSYTDAGSRFLFGDSYMDHFFAFKVLPVVVFFSTVMSMLYYLGCMQWLIFKVGFLMQVTMGTSPPESMVAAGNIFVGMTESPLLIRPYLSQLTVSEIHAVMTAGFATIAGSVLGAFISFGIEASHLLTASVMSAPASLAVAKAFWPETETPRTTRREHLRLERGKDTNLLEAASSGASSSVVLVAGMAVNLLAFLSLLSFLDAALAWLGGMFNYPHLSFAIICSYIFMPFSFLMGVAWEDSFVMGELIGLKTFFNEFVAYQRLAEMIRKREEGGPEYVDDIKQYLSVHSETIATYALCGFANFGSLGMMIGGLSAMAPGRRADISRVGVRALIAGSVACFMTACIAGMLYIPVLQCEDFLQFNSTSVNNNTQLRTCCRDLYHSVEVVGSSNVTVGGGYSWASLRACCLTVPPLTFNCSLVPP